MDRRDGLCEQVQSWEIAQDIFVLGLTCMEYGRVVDCWGLLQSGWVGLGSAYLDLFKVERRPLLAFSVVPSIYGT